MRFFFDRSTPIALAKMVRAIDEKKHSIVHHDEDKRFCQTTTDIEWMQTLRGDGQPLWNVIGGDGVILKNKVEKKYWTKLGFRIFAWTQIGKWPRSGI